MVVLGTGAAVAAGSVYKTVYDVFGHLLPRLGIKRLFLGTLYKDSFGGKFPTYFTWLTRRLVDVFTPPEWRADVDMVRVTLQDKIRVSCNGSCNPLNPNHRA